MTNNQDKESPIGSEQRDLAKSMTGFMVAWGLPLVVMVGLNFVPLPDNLFQGIVVFGLAWMGVACLMNARRCRRVHCVFTGPWFLLGSATLLLDLLDILSLDADQATLVANAALLGGVALGYATEKIWGKYWVQGR